MNKATIKDLAAQMVNLFLNNGYSKKNIRGNQLILQKIVQLHHEKGCIYYSPEVINLFIQEAHERYRRQEIGTDRIHDLIRTADRLTEYYEKGSISLSRRTVASNLPIYYKNLLAAISTNIEWSDHVKYAVRQTASPYFKWLIVHGITSFEQVDDRILRSYLLDCFDRMASNSIASCKCFLKKLHLYLYAIGLSDHNFEKIFSFETPTENKIKKPVPAVEIAAVLNAIDRSTPIGKRDHAMIMMAVVTGIRSVDILKLTFDEIDWINGEILITQHKTGKTLALPLTTDVGASVQDYILNSRPQSSLPFVFLRTKPPILQLSRTVLYQIFNTYRKKVGLTSCAVHGLRRAVGTNMVIAGIPVTTVSQVLGHSGIDPTKQYISLDSVHLKVCALGLQGFMPQEFGDSL